MEKKWRNVSMSEIDNELKELPDIEEYCKNLEKDFYDNNVLEKIANIHQFPSELRAEWQKAGKNLKQPENMNFYPDSSAVLINKINEGYCFTSLASLLLACYACGYIPILKAYQKIALKLINTCDLSKIKPKDTSDPKDPKDMVAKLARDNGTGPLVDAIEKNIDDPQNKKKMLKVVTNYSTWNGAKYISRKDFWESAIYKTFNIYQSRSDIHSLINYLDTEGISSEDELKNNHLYHDTYKIIEKALSQEDGINVSTANTLKGGRNIIFYGAPGTGKSYGITDYIKNLGIIDYDPQKDNDLVYRTTFHPEYEYSDFVGQLQPVVEENPLDPSDKRITYNFVPGVFTESLQKAYNRPDKHVVLILEEMSRANVAGVFGDIFQLLDRDSNGRSEYSINNDLIADYIWKNKEHKVYIPSNLTIIGTVNTSDQNVFAMDTAFKRRFLWKYTPTVVTGDFENNPVIELKGLDKPTDWKTFFTILDDFIVNELKLAEDKQIGAYFIKFPDGNNTAQDVVQNLLRDKLLQYLWQDVAINPQQTLFKDDIHSFSSLYTKFDHEQVFSNDFLAYFDNDGD